MAAERRRQVLLHDWIAIGHDTDGPDDQALATVYRELDTLRFDLERLAAPPAPRMLPARRRELDKVVQRMASAERVVDDATARLATRTRLSPVGTDDRVLLMRAREARYRALVNDQVHRARARELRCDIRLLLIAEVLAKAQSRLRARRSATTSTELVVRRLLMSGTCEHGSSLGLCAFIACSNHALGGMALDEI